MLISNKIFEERYQEKYNQLLLKINEYMLNPSKLKKEIEQSTRQNSKNKIRNPEPDYFSKNYMLYKGLAKNPERLKNYIIAQDSNRTKQLEFYPTIMDIEPNTTCNFKCIMCQVSIWEDSKRVPDLKLEDYKDFIDSQIGLTEVKLHGIGEPLMHKKYFEMIDYLVEKDIWVRTTTNGSLLDRNENYIKLIDSGIGEIQTSFDGATKEVFEKIRRKSDFNLVKRNLILLNKYANSKNRPYTRMWTLVQKENRHQLIDFIVIANEMGFKRLSFSTSLNPWGDEKLKTSNKEQQVSAISQNETQELLKKAKEFDIDLTFWNQAEKYSTTDSSKLCPWPFTRPYVSADLRLVPCCMISDPNVSDLGDAKNFKQSWNNDIYQSFRKAHLDGDIPEYCKDCYYQ